MLSADDERRAVAEDPMINVLVIVNDEPRRQPPTNALRLAGSLAKRDEVQLRVFRLGDAVASAAAGKQLPEGHYNLDRSARAAGPPRRGRLLRQNMRRFMTDLGGVCKPERTRDQRRRRRWCRTASPGPRAEVA